MGWEKRHLTRKDDPYRAWGYEQTVAAGRAPDGYCPVIVMARDTGGCGAALDWLAAEAAKPDGVLRMSNADIGHVKRLQGMAAGEGALAAYQRMFLIYVQENVLFAEGSDVLGAEFQTNLEVVIAGTAIGAVPAPSEVKAADSPQASTTAKACLAIIDDSIAFLHPAFTTQGRQSTLFDSIWMQQTRTPDGKVDLQNGARLDRGGIDAQLAKLSQRRERDVYEEAISLPDGTVFRAIDPTSQRHQPLAYAVSHGTHVADAAVQSYVENGGSIEALGLMGIALPVDVTQDTSGASLGPFVLAAMRDAMLWADAAGANSKDAPPLVINFSYGFTAGPKDGADPLNQAIQLMIDSRNAAGRDTALVVPMGNSFLDYSAAGFTLEKGDSRSFDWVVQPDDRTSSFLEIMSFAPKGSGSFEVSITEPRNGATATAHQIDGSTLGCANLLMDGASLVAGCSEWPPNAQSTWQRRAVMALAPTRDGVGGTATAGVWKLTVKNISGAPIEIQASVQRDDTPGSYPVLGRQSFLDAADSQPKPITGMIPNEIFDPDATLTHLRTASLLASNTSACVFAVGAGRGGNGAQEDQPHTDPSSYAGAGPRNAARGGPDATMLADRSRAFAGIYRAGTFAGTRQTLSGSSVSAPQFAGYLAANPDQITRVKQTPALKEPPCLRELRYKEA